MHPTAHHKVLNSSPASPVFGPKLLSAHDRSSTPLYRVPARSIFGRLKVTRSGYKPPLPNAPVSTQPLSIRPYGHPPMRLAGIQQLLHNRFRIVESRLAPTLTGRSRRLSSRTSAGSCGRSVRWKIGCSQTHLIHALQDQIADFIHAVLTVRSNTAGVDISRSPCRCCTPSDVIPTLGGAG